MNIPINKGNYSLDTPEREAQFARNRAFGVEDEYYRNRSEWEEFPQRFHVADYPLLVDLELSSLCNLRCPFCYTITKEFRSKVNVTLMNFGLYCKVIDEIAGKVFAVRLSLRGEPTIHPDFVKAVRYAKEKGIGEVSTLTNGSRLTPEFFVEAMEAGLDWITVSFDGLDEEYEKNRFPLKFDEIYESLRRIREIKETRGRVKPVIKIQSVWPAIKDDPSKFLRIMGEVSDLVAFNPIIDFGQLQSQKDSKYEEDFSCPQLYQRLVIGADGLAMMCSNDEENEHPVGDANQQSIHEIWHGERETKARMLHMKREGFMKLPVCSKCYLPRKTRDDLFQVNGRTLVVKNYI